MKLTKLVASTLILGFVFGSAQAAKRAPSVRAKVANANAFIDENNAKSSVPGFNWTRRITLGGQLNIDARWSNRAHWGTFADNHAASHDINVHNANLFVDARINRYTKAHMNLVYNNDLHGFYGVSGSEDRALRFDVPESFDKVKTQDQFAGVFMDEAYITIDDFARDNMYVRIGKEYVPFGKYNRYPILRSFPQILSQTRQTALEFGIIANNGFRLHLFAFNGPRSSRRDDDDLYSRVRNYGGKIGYGDHFRGVAYDLEASYLKDMRDVDFIYNHSFDFFGLIEDEGGNDRPMANRRVEAVSMHAAVTYDPWNMNVWADYVTALQGMFKDDSSLSGQDTRAWASDLEGCYSFNTFGHQSKLTAGYQRTSHLDSWLPEKRWVGNYTYNLWPNTDIELQYWHDIDYDINSNVGVATGTGRAVNVATIRLGVEF